MVHTVYDHTQTTINLRSFVLYVTVRLFMCRCIDKIRREGERDRERKKSSLACVRLPSRWTAARYSEFTYHHKMSVRWFVLGAFDTSCVCMYWHRLLRRIQRKHTRLAWNFKNYFIQRILFFVIERLWNELYRNFSF